MNASRSVKLVMSARFRRHARGASGPGTGLYDELDPCLVEAMTDRIELGENEVPVVASVFSVTEWCLLTTSRLIVSKEACIEAIENHDIKDVNCDIDACMKEGQLETQQLAYLLLRTFSGREWTLHIEPGAGYLGFVSVLQMIADRNWRGRNQGASPPCV